MNLLKKTLMVATVAQAFTSLAAFAQAPVNVNVYNRQLLINGYVVDPCVNSATIPYQFGNDTYVFAVGCDNFPYSYAVNARQLNRITDRTQVRQIQYARPNANGYVNISVIGTGGSTYEVSTGIYAAPVYQPAPVPPPYYPPAPQPPHYPPAPGPVHPGPGPGGPGHGPGPVQNHGCNVMPGHNAQGQNYWNVLDRQGRFVAQFWDVRSANNFAATDARCR
jgi:hypothetical protein